MKKLKRKPHSLGKITSTEITDDTITLSGTLNKSGYKLFQKLNKEPDFSFFKNSIFDKNTKDSVDK